MDNIKEATPLRPYYDPETFNAGYSAIYQPERGVIDESGHNIASKLTIVSQSKANGFKNINSKLGTGSTLSELTTGLKAKFFKSLENPKYGTNAKSLNDLEWSDLVNLHVWKQLLEKLAKQFMSRYFQHLIQQPFEVARLLMQVGDFSGISKNKSQSSTSSVIRGENEDAEDDDTEPSFFVTESQANLQEGEALDEHVQESRNLNLISPASIHTIDILNSIMDKEGSRGVWRANNTQFIYNFLSVSLDAWFTGLLSPILQIPDPYFIDIIHSPDVSKSAFLILLASCMTGLVLLPLDLIRVRFIVTTVNDTTTEGNERSLRLLLKKWSWRENISKLNKELVFLNVLNSLVGTGFSKLTGAILYHQFNIDKFTNGILYNTMKFCSKVCELFVKLPIENLLRRCEVKFLLNEKPFKVQQESLIVSPREYKSIYHTIFHEYDRISELWRGWRLGFLSIICGYGVKLLNKPSEALQEEKF